MKKGPRSFGTRESDHGHGTRAIPFDGVTEHLANKSDGNHGSSVQDERLDVHGIVLAVQVVLIAALGARIGGPKPHFSGALGHFNPVVRGNILDSEAELLSHSTQGDHCATGVNHDGLLVLEGHMVAVEGELKGSFAVVVEIYAVSGGNHGVLILGGPGLQGRGFHHSREVRARGLLGEDGTNARGGVHEELAAIDVHAGIVDAHAIDKHFREDFAVSFGHRGDAGLARQGRIGRAVPVDIQGRFALRPAVAVVVSPIGDDETVAGGEKYAVSFLRENLEHIALGLHANVLLAVHVGVDAAHLDVVHIHSGGTDIQVDVSGESGGAQQAEHHDDCHQAGHKPCYFFHCTFLRFRMCVG